MKGVAIFGPGDVRIVDDIPMPAIGDYECLVKIHACGFCSGTDIRIIEGKLGAGMGKYPTVLGHEGAGEVVECGRKVRYIKSGERWVHPSRYPDLGHGYSRTYGNMAEYAIVNDDRAMLEDGYKPEDLPFPKQHRFPDSIPYDDGTLIISMAECHSAVLNFGIDQNKKVMIFGAGTMGIGLSLFSRLAGAPYIVQVDHHAERIAEAKRIARVDQGILSYGADEWEMLHEKLGGETFDIIIDAVGSMSILESSSRFLKPGGKLCSFGVIRQDDRLLDVKKLPKNTSLHMLNDPDGEYRIMQETISLIEEGKVDLKDFYSDVLPMERIQDAVSMVKQRKTKKVVLTI